MSPYSVAFAGTPAFACPSLQALHDDPAFNVELVITQPDRPVGRKQVITPPPVKVLAEELEIEIMQPEDINSIQLSAFNFQPDFLVVVAYGQILSTELLSWPRIAPINAHASLLPLLRGASPIQYSILLDHKQTGITIQRMVEDLDAGPILAQETVEIGKRETTTSVHDTLSLLSAKLLPKTLKSPLQEVKQDLGKATFCGKLYKDLGIADPKKMTAEGIDRKVRALVPWPGVTISEATIRLPFRSSEGAKESNRRSDAKHRNIKLIETSLEPNPDALEIECNEGSKLYITKMQAPGKNIIKGSEW